MTSRVDAAVLGGGPAGLSTAIALVRLGRSVAVFERSGFDALKVGETLGAEVGPLLKQLGVCEDFEGQNNVPFRGSRSAWGSPEPIERSSIVHPLGEGWHVDRAKFDGMLLHVSVGLGARVAERCGRCEVQDGDGLWRITPGNGAPVFARFLVDASGRGGGNWPIPDRAWTAFDRTVGVVGWMTPACAPEPELLVETVEEGWWYSAPQPNGSLVLSLMTDSDLIQAEGRDGLQDWWLSALARTLHTAGRTSGAELTGEITVRRADSGWMRPDHGPRWCAVGDAAMACDPLAGNGIARSIRSALEAAERIDKVLGGDKWGHSDLTAAFGKYLDRRAEYYGLERRWRGAPFWVRRQPIDWRTAPVILDPEGLLHWDGRPPERDDMAAAEALLPHRSIKVLLETLEGARPAHEAMLTLRELAPLDDRRLLAGLQTLVARGIVSKSDAAAAR